MAGAACISSSSQCAITGAVVGGASSLSCSTSSRAQQQQLAMPSSSFSGDAVSPFLHAGIGSPLRIRSPRSNVASRGRRVSKAGMQVESVLADLAEENVVCHLSPYSMHAISSKASSKVFIQDMNFFEHLFIMLVFFKNKLLYVSSKCSRLLAEFLCLKCLGG